MIEILLILVMILLGIALVLNWYNFTSKCIDKNTFLILNMVNVFSLVLNFIILELSV